MFCVLLRRINDSAADVFMIIYPMLGYAFYMVKTEKFFKLSVIGKNFNRVIAGFLTCIAVVILYFSMISFKNSELVFEKNQLEITGIYGIKIRKQEIEKITLVDSLPAVTSKINGFNSGVFNKGNFTIKDRKRVKLFVNVNSGSYLFFKTVDGNVYYSSDQVDMKDLYQKMLIWKREEQSAK